MTETAPVRVILALGTNMGDRLENLRAAIARLRPFVDIEKISPVYETASAYVTDQPDFLNATLAGTTHLEPLPLLWVVKDLESDIGRVPTFRYGPRVIDIDILFYDEQIVDLPELTIPHPRIAERDFVLYPLNDIAPDLQHPQNGLTVTGMLARLPRTSPAPVRQNEAL